MRETAQPVEGWEIVVVISIESNLRSIRFTFS
jgi:hypothetical protein